MSTAYVTIFKITTGINMARKARRMKRQLSNEVSTEAPDPESPASGLNWEEVEEALRPGLPFTLNLVSGESKPENGEVTRQNPSPEESLIVLLVLLAVLLLSLTCLGIKYCWENRGRRGYSPAPIAPADSDRKHEHSEDVIAEVKNRREPKMENYSPQNKSVTMIHPPAPSPKKPPRTTLSSVQKFEPLVEREHNNGNTAFGFVSENNNYFRPLQASSPQNVPLRPSHSCPLPEAKPIKLIQIENLVVPRSFSDAIKKAYPDMTQQPGPQDVEKVLNLSKVEKSKSKTEALTPTKVTKPGRSVNGKDNVKPAEPSPGRWDFLNQEEKKKERLKFFRACWKSDVKRRRSLCSTRISENVDIVDPELYNSVLYGARKVRSMPTMKPNASATYGTQPTKSPINYDSVISPMPRIEDLSSAPLSRTSSDSSIRESLAKTMTLPPPHTYQLNYFPTNSNMTSTSLTSIWSTVATSEPLSGEGSVKAIDDYADESLTDFPGLDTDNEDADDTLSPQFLSSQNLGKKKSVAEIIEDSAHSQIVKSFKLEQVNNPSQILVADILESELFHSNKTKRSSDSTDSVETPNSISALFNQLDDRFKESVVQEFDPLSGFTTSQKSYINQWRYGRNEALPESVQPS